MANLFKNRSRKSLDKYRDLIELLYSPDLALIDALSMLRSSNNNVLDSVLYILERTGKAVDIIKLSITQVVDRALEASTLFRENSCATKIMTAYSRLIGAQYLQSTLKRLVTLLIKSHEDFEVNPAKAAPGADLEENLNCLMDWCERFVEQIVQTVDSCPIQFRYICHHLQQEVTPRFPRNRHMCVGGFVFLRFFCPAILAPVMNGLLENMVLDKDARRRLILVAKALQNLSNGVQYGSKEAYLGAMNDFIEDYQEMLYEFFDELATLPSDASSTAAGTGTSTAGGSDAVGTSTSSGVVVSGSMAAGGSGRARSNSISSFVLEESDLPSLHILHTWLHANIEEVTNHLKREGSHQMAVSLQGILDKLGTPPRA